MSAASEQLSTVAPAGLSERDREIIAFERQWWKYAGSKETAIKELFDMSSTRYYQVLNALIDHPAATGNGDMQNIKVRILWRPKLRVVNRQIRTPSPRFLRRHRQAGTVDRTRRGNSR